MYRYAISSLDFFWHMSHTFQFNFLGFRWFLLILRLALSPSQSTIVQFLHFSYTQMIGSLGQDLLGP